MPVRQAEIKRDAVDWPGSEIVKAPDREETYYVFGPRGPSKKRYVIELESAYVLMAASNLWFAFGIVLPKAETISGVRMYPESVKMPYDPLLRIGKDHKSFSFRTEEGQNISVTGL